MLIAAASTWQDDDPHEHAAWAAELAAAGKNPGAPWTRQTDALTIDHTVDYITDSGTRPNHVSCTPSISSQASTSVRVISLAQCVQSF